MTGRATHTKTIDPQFLLAAYRSGFFPMADSASGEIRWYSPDPRTIFDLNAFNVPRSIKRILRTHPFEVRFDSAFTKVIRACASRPETWISETIVESYEKLHELGFTHSVETWQRGSLVGGLYGVAIGGAFFGESMFSRVSEASKTALVALVDRLQTRGFTLLDTQYATEHLAMFGAKEISRKDYLSRLKHALDQPCAFV